MTVDQWEYTYVDASTNAMPALNAMLNKLGLVGWEVVGFASADRTIGLNAIMAVLKRRVVAPAPPEPGDPAWYADPTGRFERRYFDGAFWTTHVTPGKGDEVTGEDTPTLLPPI